MKLWSQRSQNLFFPSFEYFFWKKFFLIFWPLLGHFLVQQKFLITPFLAPGQFTTENRAIFGPNQQFFLRQKFDRKGVKNHQNIFGECSLGSKEHLKFWSFLTLSHLCHHPTPLPYPGDRHTVTSLCYRYFYSESKITWFHLSNAALRSPIRWLEKYTTLNQKPSKNHTAVFYAWFWKKKLHENEKRVLQLFSRDLIHHFIKEWITSVLK